MRVYLVRTAFIGVVHIYYREQILGDICQIGRSLEEIEFTVMWFYSYFTNFILKRFFNLLSANPTKWSNTLKQFVYSSNCLSVFDRFVGLALKELIWKFIIKITIQYSFQRKYFVKTLTMTLIYFKPIFHFYISWKRQKTRGFQMFSGGIEMECWSEMD